MCIYESIDQRNAIVEQHLWCIDEVIRANHANMVAAHLDYDDVYQWLAIRLIQAVTNYDTDKGILRQHIFAQLRYELRSCWRSRRKYGLTQAPRHVRYAEVSLEALEEEDPDWELLLAG